MSRVTATGQAERVRRFYDRNAARFERLGQGGASMHRAVWGPGVGTRQGAFHHVEDLLLHELPATSGRPLVVDLGCGVGASLLHLAGQADLAGDGLTISPAQAARAGQLIAAAGLADRVRCRVGDFLDPPADLAGADLVYSIEAFVHGPDPVGYFQAAAGLLRPGGRLVLVDDVLMDDVLAGPPDRLADGDAGLVRRFRDGWRVGSLLTPDRLRELAGAAGLVPVRDRDLTPYLELRRPRDRLIGVLLALSRPLRPGGEYWRALDGGDALQRALLRGVIAYRFVVFERADPRGAIRA